MKIGIVGAGGVGGLLAGFLLSNGHDVIVSGRGEHASAILHDGLRVHVKDKKIQVRPTAVLTDDLSSFSQSDVIILTVKMYDLENICLELSKVLNPKTTIITMQNGVEAPNLVKKYFPNEYVTGGSIITSSRIESPGLIVHEGNNLKVSLENKNNATKQLSEALNTSVVSCEKFDDIQAVLWKKLIRLASVSGITCLKRQPFGWVQSNIFALDFMRKLIKEAYHVAISCGVTLPDSTIEDSFQGLYSHATPHFKPSMLLDLERGKRLEVTYLSGAICRLGREKNISTLAHDAVMVALAPFENGTA